jgi:phosphoribosylamine--glycine ligase
MMRLQSDLAALCEAALDVRLHQVEAQWDPRASIGVVLASGGYPEVYDKGAVIHGLETITGSDSDAKVFHAGTTLKDGKVVTNGGRVLCAVALGETVTGAQKAAYALVDRISWDRMMCRRDIGYRAITREMQRATPA